VPARFDAHLPAQLKVRGICAARANKRKSCGEDFPEASGEDFLEARPWTSGGSAVSAESAESGELAAPTELTEPGETARLRAEVNSLVMENRLLRESAEAAKATEDAWKQERAELHGQVAQLRPG
jgi:hypothetical protein